MHLLPFGTIIVSKAPQEADEAKAGYARRLFGVSRVCDNEQYIKYFTLKLPFENCLPVLANDDCSEA